MEKPSQSLSTSFMRGEATIISCKPGGQAPTIAQLLLARIEQYVREAGLSSQQIAQEVLPTFLSLHPEPLALTQTDSMDTIVISALYSYIWEEVNTAFSGGDSVATTTKLVIIELTARKQVLNEAMIYDEIHDIIQPYLNDHRFDSRLYIQKPPATPVLAHPLAIASPKDGIIECITYLIKSERTRAIEKLKSSSIATLKTLISLKIPEILHTLNRLGEATVENIDKSVDGILDACITPIEIKLYQQNTKLPPDLYNTIQLVAKNNPTHKDLLVLAAEYYTTHLPLLVELTSDQKQIFIKALENMPIVQAMYNGTLEEMQETDGLHLKSLEPIDGAETQPHFAQFQVKFIDVVTAGLTYYSALVELPHRPPEAYTANILICPDSIGPLIAGSRAVQPFRADAAREQNKLRLSVTDNAFTVTHELGHQVEFYLPICDWLNIHRLLRMRLKSTVLIDIYNNGEEAALDTAMPAFANIEKAFKQQKTSLYAAKIYSSGDTEVMSLSLEYFCQPKGAPIIIREDPLLAAIILLAVHPEQASKFFTHEMLQLLQLPL